ncbi:MAG: hypothetical protein K2J88_01385, partial [Oscillospiraceae bacterium]|nr:hypothetical protein [Oscillospiraceae bacterium]
ITNHSVITTETTTTTTTIALKNLTTTTTEPLHTLSTWAVSIETIATTEKPDPNTTAWYDAIFTTVSKQTNSYNMPYEKTITELTPVVTEPVITNFNSESMEIITELPVQTITETVVQPVITEAPPVITDSPVTAPVTDNNNIPDTALEDSEF